MTTELRNEQLNALATITKAGTISSLITLTFSRLEQADQIMLS